MLLENRVAIVYGAGGSIGRTVARAFAREGAVVHLAGRTLESLEALAAEIREAGGRAEVAVVDALDETQVDAHAAAVVAASGRIDVSINLIAIGDVQGTPLVEMTLADFEQPIHRGVRTAFLTGRAAARQMATQGSGVLLFFGGVGDPVKDYSIGGFQVALHAVDALQKQFAAELGRSGIRSVMIQTGGIAETLPVDMPGRDEIMTMLTEPTMLGRAATLADVGNVVAFAASDHAAAITGSDINISAGTILP